MNETLADLYRQVGLQPAWERQPEAQPGYRPPRPLPRQMRPLEQRLYDPNAGVRDQAGRQMRQQRARAQASVGRGLGGDTGFAANNQVQEAGQIAMEMTGAPSLARGVQHVGRGEPGEAIPELLMGGLGALGMATLPYGGGQYAAATRQPMGLQPRPAPLQLPPPATRRAWHVSPHEFTPEPTGIPRPPPRLPGRATDGSVLPVRPPEPFRNSMRGGSDDLMSATRAPDAGDAGAGNATAAPEMQRGYHGSTSNFDAFDARFVGSGQGDNAQGWGINIDQNRASARRYAGRLGRQNGPGVLYEVEFPQGPFLDAELPLNQQPAEVQALAQQLGYPTTNALVRELRAPSRFNTQRQASEAFRAAGVRGLRYRSSKNIDSHGYLIFDPADARIVTRDGQPVGARAQTDGGRLGAGNARTRPWDAELLLPQERTGIVDRLRGARTYETPNATVRVSPRGDFREVEWDLKDGSASMSLADRARAEAEGINAARDALRQDMAAHPNARYYIEPSTQALFRRYRRIADDLGLTARPVGDGLVLERNAPNARPPPRTPPQRPNR